MKSRLPLIRLLTVTVMTTSCLVGQVNLLAAELSPDAADVNSRKQARAESRALTHAVRQSLTKAKGLDSSHINILARGAFVTLTGSAPEQSQIETAQSVAAKVDGVARVDNRLTITEEGH